LVLTKQKTKTQNFFNSSTPILKIKKKVNNQVFSSTKGFERSQSVQTKTNTPLKSMIKIKKPPLHNKKGAQIEDFIKLADESIAKINQELVPKP